MSQVTIYHNPRCSKSRETLKLLQSKGIEPKVVEYLDTPPSKAQLKKLLSMLNLQPREFMRKKEAVYKELGLADETITDSKLIEIMIENPKLIERPIVVCSDKAAIGRPPEQVLEIL